MSLADKPAFPHFEDFETWGATGNSVTRQMPRGGLTTRQYFAALAMQGLLANPKSYENNVDITTSAVVAADALIAKLEAK